MKSYSSLCFGQIFHQRVFPRKHSFTYSSFSPMLDLDDLPEVKSHFPWLGIEKPGLYSFHSSDYLSQESEKQGSLKLRVLEALKARLANDPLANRLLESNCRVLLLAQWRFLGRVFNPITIYYILYRGKPVYMLAEVSNTPWKERQIYLHKLNHQGEKERWSCQKVFHVSPYNPMNMQYHWTLVLNSNKAGLTLKLTQDHVTHLLAGFSFKREDFTRKNFIRGILRQPLFSLQTVFRIYWQALKLWIKRIPLYEHPDKSSKGEH